MNEICAMSYCEKGFTDESERVNAFMPLSFVFVNSMENISIRAVISILIYFGEVFYQ